MRRCWEGVQSSPTVQSSPGLRYANTYLQLFKMFIAILCLNGVEQLFKRHQCPFFLPLRRGNPPRRRGSFRPRGGRPPQRPTPLDPRLIGIARAAESTKFQRLRLRLRLRVGKIDSDSNSDSDPHQSLFSHVEGQRFITVISSLQCL